MKFIKALVVCLIVVLISACGGLSKNDTNAWLEEKKGPVNVNLTGEWDTGGVWTGGWGKANFIQEGKSFSGTLGLYYAEGVVSGDEIYMVIFSGRKVYYTALLKKIENGTYRGKVANKALVDHPDSKNAEISIITMKRMTVQ